MGRHWQGRGYAAVVVAGGDGTVGAGATQVAESSLPLGILPLGTSNDVARSLGVPLDLAQASAVIAEGIAQGVAATIDLGRVVPVQAAWTAPWPIRVWHWLDRILPPHILPRRRVAALGGRYFLHTLTLGLNVEFAKLATDSVHRRRWGALTYPAAFIEALTHFRPVAVTLELVGVAQRNAAESTVHEGKTRIMSCLVAQVAIVNTPVIGGAAHVSLSGVDPRDRLLDVIVIEAPQVPRLREILAGFQSARDRSPRSSAASAAEHEADSLSGEGGPVHDPSAGDSTGDAADGRVLPGIYHLQGRAIRLASAEPVALTVDGELTANTPVEISIAPTPLYVLLPS